MAKKLDSIVELAAQKTREISANSGNYMAFLTTAAHNFKYDFRDQLLIYAQKPDATACAQIDFWNKHGRYVNRGTRGIALLVDTDRGYKLRYVFDMSDTNSRQGRTIPIWKMEPRYEDTVIEALENSYGEFPDRSGLAACLLETANDLPTAQALPGIAGRLDDFAAAMQRSLCQPAGNSSEISPNE